jgi:hypothetical protein
VAVVATLVAVAEARAVPAPRAVARPDRVVARPREARVTTTPERAAAAGGRLSLRSVTAGTVFEGERRIGHTPIVGAPMSVGSHALRLVPDEPADEAQEIDVEIEPGAESTVALRH